MFQACHFAAQQSSLDAGRAARWRAGQKPFEIPFFSGTYGQVLPARSGPWRCKSRMDPAAVLVDHLVDVERRQRDCASHLQRRAESRADEIRRKAQRVSRGWDTTNGAIDLRIAVGTGQLEWVAQYALNGFEHGGEAPQIGQVLGWWAVVKAQAQRRVRMRQLPERESGRRFH